MQFRNVCLESFGYTLPDEIVSSAELESRLAPLYERLRLPEGRFELMTGIRERRFWPRGTLPSDASAESGRRALLAADFDRSLVGACIHGSVCRDRLEPASAARVHHLLGLSSDCLVYDVSNACLGFLNGIIQVAQQIELGQIRAGLVVGTESGRALVENTVADLNRDQSLSRQDIKPAFASLTVGSASCAALLVERELSRSGSPLDVAITHAATAHHTLCESHHEGSAESDQGLLMQTDSEALLAAGVAAASEGFAAFTRQTGWDAASISKTVCHQVGAAHRKRLLEQLGLSPARDFSTFEFLGNTGAVALPISAAMAAKNGHLAAGDRVALLGIGSGINVLMLGLLWQRVGVVGDTLDLRGSAADQIRATAKGQASKPQCESTLH